MVANFIGNARVVATLWEMMRQQRIPQTILLSGPGGIGKATLVRRFAAELLAAHDTLERDDLSLENNREAIEEREKWTADRRNEDPLLFGAYPDFLTFPPDGPLRQISMPQMRLLRDRAQYTPLRGRHRVFLIDGIDRANEQAANSLLKILEEPPPHLVTFLVADNSYNLLPTIRSRAVLLQMTPLSTAELREFALARGLDRVERRLALAAGSPGVAVTLDLEVYDRRRDAMLTLLEVAARLAPFGRWAAQSEKLGSGKAEKLEAYLSVLYLLLGDLLRLSVGRSPERNPDIEAGLRRLVERVDFAWIRRATVRVDELISQLRRNIQRAIALDALVVELRGE